MSDWLGLRRHCHTFWSNNELDSSEGANEEVVELQDSRLWETLTPVLAEGMRMGLSLAVPFLNVIEESLRDFRLIWMEA
jgi:hypothetical protein